MKKLIAVILLCSTLISAQTICDSVSYNIGSGQAFMLTGVNNSSDSVNFQWGVCYNLTCYSKTGDTVVFADVTTLDTVSVCFDISPQWSCNDCQYLVFANGSWQPITTTRAKAARDLAAAKTPNRRAKKAENQRLRRAAKKAGVNLDNKDYDHKDKKFKSVKSNRGNDGKGTKNE